MGAVFSNAFSNIFDKSGGGSPTYFVSGNCGVAGALVNYSGGVSGGVYADSSGNFTVAGLSDGAYVITPFLAGYTFSPASQNPTVAGASIPGVDFTATPVTYSIKGNAGAAGATVSLVPRS